MLAVQEDTRVKHDGDNSSSDLDPEDLAMIGGGTTQIEVRVEGGSRTITILVNRVIGPLCLKLSTRLFRD